MSRGRHTDAVRDDDSLVGGLQALLEALPDPLEPLDTSAVDGFLCGVLSQPRMPATKEWLRWIVDAEGRPPPQGVDLAPIRDLVQRRLVSLRTAIEARDWFDPWVFEVDGATPSECVVPWVAGFAAAIERFPALTSIEGARLIEPLALLYRHFDPDDLEDAEALIELIDTLEPPADLADAVQDLVAATMLIADVVHPRPQPRPVAAGRKVHRRG